MIKNADREHAPWPMKLVYIRTVIVMDKAIIPSVLPSNARYQPCPSLSSHFCTQLSDHENAKSTKSCGRVKRAVGRWFTYMAFEPSLVQSFVSSSPYQQLDENEEASTNQPDNAPEEEEPIRDKEGCNGQTQNGPDLEHPPPIA